MRKRHKITIEVDEKTMRRIDSLVETDPSRRFRNRTDVIRFCTLMKLGQIEYANDPEWGRGKLFRVPGDPPTDEIPW